MTNSFKWNKSLKLLCENYKLIESVDNSNQEKKIILKGRALRLGEPTRNGVRYSLPSQNSEKILQSMIGKPFLDSHNDESIRNHPPYGHVIVFERIGEDLMYEVDIDPEEKVFIRKAKRGDIPGVSIQVFVDDAVEDGEGVLNTVIKEFLELSSVLIPGERETNSELSEELRFVESFRKTNKVFKEGLEEKPEDIPKQAKDITYNQSEDSEEKQVIDNLSPEDLKLFNEMIKKEYISQRDNQYCVIHDKGPEKGKPIKCYPTKGEALKLLQAIMANKKEAGTAGYWNLYNTPPEDEKIMGGTKVKEDARPPEDWFDKCVKAVDGKVKDPNAICGWMYYHKMSNPSKEQLGTAIEILSKESLFDPVKGELTDEVKIEQPIVDEARKNIKDSEGELAPLKEKVKRLEKKIELMKRVNNIGKRR